MSNATIVTVMGEDEVELVCMFMGMSTAAFSIQRPVDKLESNAVMNRKMSQLGVWKESKSREIERKFC